MAVPRPQPTMGENNFETREESSTFLFVINAVNTLTNLCLGAITIGAIIFANVLFESPISFFPNALHQHIYLCVIGYIVLMSQAIMSMNPYCGWSSMFRYEQRKNIHWFMQVGGSILAIAGSCIRIASLDSHFSSTHGILGILALIFTLLSLIGGCINLFSSNLGISPKAIRIGHTCIGSLTMVCAFLCLVAGFNTEYYFRGVVADKNANMLIALTVIGLLGMLAPVCLSLIRRSK